MLPEITQTFDHIFSNTIDVEKKRTAVSIFIQILYRQHDSAIKLLTTLAQLDTFEYFSNIPHSVVVIGANGSGKSSFSRNTQKVLTGNVVIISAQKIFAHQAIRNIPIGDEPLQDVFNFQKSSKLGKDYNGLGDHGQDLHNLLLSLIAEHSKTANQFYSACKNRHVERCDSVLEQVMQIWGKIITHRRMKYEEPNIKIYPNKGAPYDLPQLSDGEKAAFYYISHMLLAKKNSFIIVDEPENHLHMGVVSKLWDKLESLRDDCTFIYLTHNLAFASSRTHATKLWSKSFTPPAKWDVVPLPQDENLPESLLMEILGSRNRILFCEGEKSSLDYRLYRLLYPQYTVKPVGGHLNVINYTRAFNKSQELFNNTAIGIIDGDFHLKAAKSKWESDSIYCINAQEVENLLCDEALLSAGEKQFHCPSNEFDKAKQSLFKEIEKGKDSQAIEYATQVINNTLKSNLLKSPKTIADLQDQFDQSIKSIDINTLINERISLFDKILQNKDFDSGVRFYNNKGLVGIVGAKIVGDYRNRIFGLLESDSDLLAYFRDKYFSMIPHPD